MAKKKKITLTKKELKEKYPEKKSGDVEVAKFAGRLFAVLGIFVLVAMSVDVYRLVH
jgi:hypothetical protein